MCGIVALLDRSRVRDPEGCVERALELMEHRGAPGRMAIQDGGFGTLLGHVRLPIVGLDRKYDQPWVEDDCTLAFAGEIHNYRDLMPSAECDVQVIVPRWRHLLHEGWGDFDGFWQIALVDKRLGLAAIAVDYLAQKPLYFRMDTMAFCSELEPLKAFGPLTLDETYLSNVRKWGYDPTGLTPYREVGQMLPGCLMIVTLRGKGSEYCTKQYYPLNKIQTTDPDPTFQIKLLQGAVAASVKARLVSDVPIAVLLSGGLDSTIVAGLAKKLGGNVTAFHVPNEEAEYARLAADHFGIELRELPTYGGWEDVGRLAMQEPVDLGSVTPQLGLGMGLKEAGFRVVLSGDGADELFGGYRRAAEYDSQASDVFVELVHYHLPRLDRLMMASTVELRCPFLAPYVISVALGLPYPLRRRKEALKAAFAGLVPPAILGREKKPLRGHDPHDQQIRNMIVDEFVRRHHSTRNEEATTPNTIP